MPTVLIIFGATGDLMRKKLVPALFHLHQNGKLPRRFRVLGFARREFSDPDFRRYVRELLSKHRGIGKKGQTEFVEMFSYQSGFFQQKNDYLNLESAIQEVDAKWGTCSNKLFYLAVPPRFYKTIFKHLASSGLTKPCGPDEGWTRVIVEKPFGKDLKTSQKLDEMLGRLFKEEQIYRIDHYLAKEMIQNILTFRFANNLLEKNWSRDTIERIDIHLWEKLGVEDRGSFYDEIGALRDVGQNHLLQMLALVAMDRPEEFSAYSVRTRRKNVLSALRAPDRDEVRRFTLRAQYEGYRSIRGVKSNSTTETYFRVRAFLDSPRWRDVPVMMESGKRLGRQRKEIELTFRHPSPCLCPRGAGHFRNKIVMALEPEEKITIHFWSKKPGLSMDIEERTFEFRFRSEKQKTQYVEEYEKLLLDCIVGDQTLFVSTEEVREMWRFIDPIIHGWQKKLTPLSFYRPDTAEIIHKADDAWRGEGIPEKGKIKKEIGVVGLGKMGKNMAFHLVEKGWKVTAFDRKPEKCREVEPHGIRGFCRIDQFVDRFTRPRLFWLMIPAGKPVDEMLFGEYNLVSYLNKGDTVVDGGNSFYQDSIIRAKKLKKLGINFLDAGVSGGPEGARRGASLMIGGPKEIYEKYEQLFRDLAVPGGYGHVGKLGAGHFVKMVHNGIEYGMMQALAEGFSILNKSSFNLDLAKVSDIYNNGSVIESRLVGWLKDAFDELGEDLKGASGSVAHTGEGEWTVKTAKKLKIHAPVIKAAFGFRVKSKKKPSYTGKILSALRGQFGGHDIRRR